MKNSPKELGAVVLTAIAVSTLHAEAGAVPADAHFRSSYLVLNAETSENASRPFALGDVNNDQAIDLVLR